MLPPFTGADTSSQPTDDDQQPIDRPPFSSTPSAKLLSGTHASRVQLYIPPAKAPELDSTQNNEAAKGTSITGNAHDINRLCQQLE